MIDRDFLPTFLDEAVETLATWEQLCLVLESSPDEAQVNALFRAAHNLKGSSRSIGLEHFGAFVHLIEDTITDVKKDLRILTPVVVGIFLECQSLLSQWIESIKSDPDVQLDTALLQQKLAALRPINEKASVPADAGFGFFEDPAPPPVEKKNLGDILIENGHASPEQIDKAVKVQNAKLGQILVAQGVTTKQAVREALAIQKKQGATPDESIRVSIKKLDTLIRLVGELSIQHSIMTSAHQSGQLDTAKAAESIALTTKVIQDLQGESMNLRMQPVESLFRRLDRVARDVARSQDKQINVVLKGFDVEMDKTVLEQMKDPLVHIIRNAVDHGLETTDGRTAAGKSTVSQVTIAAAQTAQNVLITISDDGRGLAKEKILKKARERGLVGPEQKLTASEINNLIFMPGFSTAEKVTDVSGRGVGMDVVKSAVTALQGQIEIQSTEGAGTNFVIVLPSTLSVLDAIIVSNAGAVYAVPIQDVREVVDLKSFNVETSGRMDQMINLRGKIIPVEPMSRYLPQHSDGVPGKVIEQPNLALVTGKDKSQVALAVDAIIGKQSIVVRPVDRALDKIPGFSGATILSSGDPAMIIHLPQILKSFQTRAS